MRTLSKEDYMDSDQSSRDTKNSTQISQIDKILNQMQSTYRAHIEAQQCYIDILKRNNKNINSKYIKYIYALFSQTKANQICFQKEWEKIMQFELSQKVIRRYYARMIQIAIRKVSYFWMNSSALQFLSSHIIKLMRVIRTCFNQIHKIKGLQFHFKVLKMFFHQNSLIEQKIYELLIDQGYLISMDQFYRINGVDLVADRQYHRKSNTKLQSPSIQDSQQESFIKKQQNSIKSKTKSKDAKRVWGQKKVQTPILSLTQLQKNKTKIKDMLESIVKVLKTSAEQEKQNLSQLEVIEQQNEHVSKTQRENLEPKEESQVLENQNKTKKRLSNVVVPEIRKRLNEKKISIELISYFSKEFKSVLSEPQQVDINCISELLIARESNSKSLPTAYIKMNSNQPSYIHSLKSFESLQRIREQKKRGKLIEMAVKMKNEQALSQMCSEMNDNSHIEFRPSFLKQKFSFRSTPGVYITVPKRKESKLKIQSKISKKSNGINKFLIRQNLGKENIFENELIVNQLASRQSRDYRNIINYTEINGDSLLQGVLSPKVGNWKTQKQNLRMVGSGQNENENEEEQKKKTDKIKSWMIKSKLVNKTDYRLDKKESVNLSEQKNKSVLQKCPSSNRFSYTIYDRLRRRILPR